MLVRRTNLSQRTSVFLQYGAAVKLQDFSVDLEWETKVRTGAEREEEKKRREWGSSGCAGGEDRRCAAPEEAVFARGNGGVRLGRGVKEGNRGRREVPEANLENGGLTECSPPSVRSLGTNLQVLLADGAQRCPL